MPLKKMKKAERQPHVLRLHLCGFTGLEIAAKLSVTSGTISTDLQELEREGYLAEAANNLKPLQLIDLAASALSEKVIKGDTKSIEVLMQVLDTRHKISGDVNQPSGTIEEARRIVRSVQNKEEHNE